MSCGKSELLLNGGRLEAWVGCLGWLLRSNKSTSSGPLAEPQWSILSCEPCDRQTALGRSCVTPRNRNDSQASFPSKPIELSYESCPRKSRQGLRCRSIASPHRLASRCPRVANVDPAEAGRSSDLCRSCVLVVSRANDKQPALEPVILRAW